jgi:hypothetical protein
MNELVWAWQPFGPGETINCFVMLGSHYRGFPVIKVTDEQKQRIQAGERMEFKYKGVQYMAMNGQVERIA